MFDFIFNISLKKINKMKIGLKIKELRTEFGYTQSELSELSGLSLRSIQRIESNEVNPRSYTLKVLGEVFNENLVTIKLNAKTIKFWKFIIPINLSSFIQQLKGVDNKHIWTSLAVGLCIAFSIYIGDATNNLGLWLGLGIFISSIIWGTANYKELKKLNEKKG